MKSIIKINCNVISIIAVLILGITSIVDARLFETEDQIEARFGKALENNHQIFNTPDGKELQKLPDDSFFPLNLRLAKALLALAESPLRDNAMSLLFKGWPEEGIGGYGHFELPQLSTLKRQVVTWNNVVEATKPKVYLKDNYVIQIIYFYSTFKGVLRGDKKVSVQERYYTRADLNSYVLSLMNLDQFTAIVQTYSDDKKFLEMETVNKCGTLKFPSEARIELNTFLEFPGYNFLILGEDRRLEWEFFKDSSYAGITGDYYGKPTVPLPSHVAAIERSILEAKNNQNKSKGF